MPADVAEAFAEMYAGFAAGLLSPKGDRTVQVTTPIDEVLAGAGRLARSTSCAAGGVASASAIAAKTTAHGSGCGATAHEQPPPGRARRRTAAAGRSVPGGAPPPPAPPAPGRPPAPGEPPARHRRVRRVVAPPFGPTPAPVVVDSNAPMSWRWRAAVHAGDGLVAVVLVVGRAGRGAIAAPMAAIPDASVKSVCAALLKPGLAPNTVAARPVASAPVGSQLWVPVTLPTEVISTCVAGWCRRAGCRPARRSSRCRRRSTGAPARRARRRPHEGVVEQRHVQRQPGRLRVVVDGDDLRVVRLRRSPARSRCPRKVMLCVKVLEPS